MLKNRIHPGEFLKEELLKRGISQSKLARHIKVEPGVINLICKGHRGISAQMAKKLGAAFGTSAKLWIDLQTRF